eukprot:m.212303 g.212303  ORF g.212303 m.212303 type:complete len:1469 (+) comp15075_c2_seq2:145-4551(+)
MWLPVGAPIAFSSSANFHAHSHSHDPSSHTQSKRHETQTAPTVTVDPSGLFYVVCSGSVVELWSAHPLLHCHTVCLSNTAPATSNPVDTATGSTPLKEQARPTSDASAMGATTQIVDVVFRKVKHTNPSTTAQLALMTSDNRILFMDVVRDPRATLTGDEDESTAAFCDAGVGVVPGHKHSLLLRQGKCEVTASFRLRWSKGHGSCVRIATHSLTALALIHDELFVATDIGTIERIKWRSGALDASHALSVARLKQEKVSASRPDTVIHMCVHVTLRALVLVLRSGSVLCVAYRSDMVDYKVYRLVPPPTVQQPRAIMAAFNTKFQLVCVGNEDASADVYHLDVEPHATSPTITAWIHQYHAPAPPYVSTVVTPPAASNASHVLMSPSRLAKARATAAASSTTASRASPMTVSSPMTPFAGSKPLSPVSSPSKHQQGHGTTSSSLPTPPSPGTANVFVTPRHPTTSTVTTKPVPSRAESNGTEETHLTTATHTPMRQPRPSADLLASTAHAAVEKRVPRSPFPSHLQHYIQPHYSTLESTATGSVHIIPPRLYALLWTPDMNAFVRLTDDESHLFITSVFGNNFGDTTATPFYTTAGGSTRAGMLAVASPHPMTWHPSGFHLMVAMPSGVHSVSLVQVSFAQSASATSLAMQHFENVVLIGDSGIYVNPDCGTDTAAKSNVDRLCNTQWQYLQVPALYLSNNWPILTVASDEHCRHVALAGTHGFMLSSTLSPKWRMFGSLHQEQSFAVTAGLAWWRSSHVVAAVQTVGEGMPEFSIRLYNATTSLHADQPAALRKLKRPVDVLSVLDNYVLLITKARKLLILQIHASDGTETAHGATSTGSKDSHLGSLVFDTICVVDLTQFNIYEHDHIVGASLCAISMESMGSPAPGSISSVVLNVAGKLSMCGLEELSSSQKVAKGQTHALMHPHLLAMAVECHWVPPLQQAQTYDSSIDKIESGARDSLSLLQMALWLNCGNMGLKIWFPLEDSTSAHESSRRVMLTFELDVPPIALMFREAVVVGASIDLTQHTLGSSGHIGVAASLQRRTHLYMHSILRQLLRRGLQETASRIAQSLTGLPYFPHVLELLLHVVLEDEALAKLELEDCIMPKVIAFLKQYPEYLDVVVHCTRKTEVFKWQYLFQFVGHPEDLFQQCIVEERFETAASCLMVMQALQPPQTTRQQAINLLDITLSRRLWTLSNDIVRFFQATASEHDDGKAPVHALICKHCLNYLSHTHRLDHLGVLSTALRFDLCAWLEELEELEGRISNMAKAIENTTQHFVPQPHSDSTRATPVRAVTSPLNTAREQWNHQLDIRKDQLRFLSDSMQGMKCKDWPFIIALLLEDDDRLNAVVASMRAPSQAVRTIVRTQVAITTLQDSGKLPQEQADGYVDRLRALHAQLPQDDPDVQLIVQADIEREIVSRPTSSLRAATPIRGVAQSGSSASLGSVSSRTSETAAAPPVEQYECVIS